MALPAPSIPFVTQTIQPLLLDVRGVADLLAITPSDVRKLVKAKHLPDARPIGSGFVRWHRGEVERHFAEVFGMAEQDTVQKAGDDEFQEKLNAFRPPKRRAKIR